MLTSDRRWKDGSAYRVLTGGSSSFHLAFERAAVAQPAVQVASEADETCIFIAFVSFLISHFSFLVSRS